ncbi:MAG: Peptidoglycan-N-acetylglucosamine deacetylase [Pelotomaculum sp. PtaB.Bin104]|jgi:peptidoglycan/xylan/chitin deacetylase (PgdA/CDA1 family)|nr:MAG: Peptidoglycan-N-acetylglucosamine deacetylase [Pelotomaculum sp. PtaB.Bin104]
MIVPLFLLSFCVLLLLYIPVPWGIGYILRIRQKQKAVRNNQIYLTFDDGPGNRLTPHILSILNENDIKATFFLLGRNVAGREAVLRSIDYEGHCIASHSYSHFHSWKVLPWKSVFDIKQGLKSINDVLSQAGRNYAYRPPCGKLNIFSLVYLCLKKIPVVFWSIDCLDTWPKDLRNVKFAAQKIRENKGGIVLFHDFDRTTETVDEYVLDSLKAAIIAGKDLGLEFSTIDRLIEKGKE